MQQDLKKVKEIFNHFHLTTKKKLRREKQNEQICNYCNFNNLKKYYTLTVFI